MKRTTRLEQVEQILLDHPDGLRVIEISERCDVDRRTIYRDLEVLQEMGIPIWQANGRYGIEREQYLANVRVNLNEAFTLLWAVRLLTQQINIENPHVESLINKVMNAFPSDVSHQIDKVRDATRPIATNDRYMDVIEKLARAWTDGIKVMMWYKSQYKSKPIRLIVAPFVLDSTAQGKLYMIGMEELSREILVFNVQRITKLDILANQPFERDLNLDVRGYLTALNSAEAQPEQNELVVLRFQKDATLAVQERQWYPSQRIEYYDDGSCIFMVEVDDWHEMETWVRSWGAQVEVIAPFAFRQTIAAEFKQAAKLYG